jgi:hypothetical protein
VGIVGMLAVGCSARPGEEGTSEDAIYGGVRDLGAIASEAVVLVDMGNSLCSGALVAPNVVLTARHCVTRTVPGGIACDEAGNSRNGTHFRDDIPATSIRIFTGQTPAGAAPRATAKHIRYPQSSVLCNMDIAFIVLDRDVAGIAPLAVRTQRPVVAGETIRAVGYGRNNTGDAPQTRLRREGVRVLAAGPQFVAARGTVVASREFEVTQSICSGDSGGPAISEQTGAVIGVVSRGGDCSNDYGQIYTTTRGFPNLFTEVQALAGRSLVEEGTVTDGGTPTDASLDASADGATPDGGAMEGGVPDGGGSDGGEGPDGGTGTPDGGVEGGAPPAPPPGGGTGSGNGGGTGGGRRPSPGPVDSVPEEPEDDAQERPSGDRPTVPSPKPLPREADPSSWARPDNTSCAAHGVGMAGAAGWGGGLAAWGALVAVLATRLRRRRKP